VKASNLAVHYERVHPRARSKLSKEERAAMDRTAVRRNPTPSRADWRIPAIVVAVLVVALGAAGAWIATQASPPPAASGKITVTPGEWDFGNIGQAVVSHNFVIQNAGSSPLRLDGISTSCMCTSAELVYNGVTSPRFGQHNNPPWTLTMAAGTQGVLTVFYDPAVHPELGHFQRDVYILSSDPAQREVTVTIHATEV
jgi:hypothetical protein